MPFTTNLKFKVADRWLTQKEFLAEADQGRVMPGIYETFKNSDSGIAPFLPGTLQIQQATQDMYSIFITKTDAKAALAKFISDYPTPAIKKHLALIFLYHFQQSIAPATHIWSMQDFQKLEKVFQPFKQNQLPVDSYLAIFLLPSSFLKFCLENQIFKLEVNVQHMGFTPLFNLLTSIKDMDKAVFLIKNGADINYRHPSNGTFLHSELANEAPASALRQLISIVQTASNNAFNFALKDAGGKTPLLIAVKTCNKDALSLLLEQHNSSRNIGLNEPDNEGRTPLLIAAALGQYDMVRMLLVAGANPNHLDNAGRDLNWYLKAPRDFVADLLKSIHIEPERHIGAPCNYVMNSQKEYILYAKNSDDTYERLVISNKKEHFDRIKTAIAELENLLKASPTHAEAKQTLSLLRDQTKCLFNHIQTQSILDVCMTEQKKAQEEVKKFKEQKLRIACALGQLDKVKTLIAEGVNPPADELQRTLLHWAVMRSDLVKHFLPQGYSEADLSNCMQGHADVVAYLLAYKHVDLNAKNKNGNTATQLVERDMVSQNPLDKATAIKIQAAFKSYVPQQRPPELR